MSSDGRAIASPSGPTPTIRRGCAARGLALGASLALTASLALAACRGTGQIIGEGPAFDDDTPGAEPGADGKPGSGTGGSGPAMMPAAPVQPEDACDPAQTAFAPARLWQLTDAQYVNVVRDVFAVTLTADDAEIVSTGAADQYTGYSEGIAIGAQVAPNYQIAAEKVATRAVASLAALVGSDAPTSAQIQSFITTKVARAWRRPVAPVEVAALMKIYDEAQPDTALGLGLVLQAILQAPSFLYRTELGTNAATAAGPIQLTAFELASALSFFMLDTAPDDRLWAKAQDGTLADAAVLAAEVDRLMQLPAARAHLTRKASYWLGLEALPSKLRNGRLYPEYTDTLKSALYTSVQTFLKETLWNGTFADLFRSSVVYANRELATVYGLGTAPRSGMVALTVAGAERAAGILSQPGLLVAANKWNERGDPIHRGLMIYNSFVCGAQIPPPPPSAFMVGAMMNGSEREKASMRAHAAACAPCHEGFDPLGLTFERYDALGRYSENHQAVLDSTTGVTSWRTTTTPIDASSTVSQALGAPLAGNVSGLNDLAARLATDAGRVGACAARRLAEYSLGHNPDAENSCAIKAVKDGFVKSGSFSAFFRALALSPGFRTRDARPH